jgi:secondary thiamine-phosphate synthase enzyme
MVHQARLHIPTAGRSFVDLTAKVAQVVEASRVSTGLCSVFLRHTSAGLLIQENADPAVRRDLARWMEWVAAERPPFGAWEHDAEGPDDMPSHVRTLLSRTSETVPVREGRLGLGTWQGLWLWEHRAAPHTREVLVTVVGEPA